MQEAESRRVAFACVLVCAVAVSSCGTGSGAPHASSIARRDATAPIALASQPRKPGEVLVRGQASPSERGPYALAGRYTVAFEQSAPEDPRLDFGHETRFVAHLAQPGAQSAGRSIRLFDRAAKTARKSIDVPRGSWRLIVDFGDYPYVIRLTPSTP